MNRVTGIEEFQGKMRAYAKAIRDPKDRSAILASGGAVIARRSKPKMPVAPKAHYYYSKGKKYKIQPGNLRKSMKVFRGKDGDVYIGPRVLRRITGDIGATAKTSSGFYAAALFGSTLKFRQSVTEAAAIASLPAITAAVEKSFSKFHYRQPVAQ